jgi:hypothetical protein
MFSEDPLLRAFSEVDKAQTGTNISQTTVIKVKNFSKLFFYRKVFYITCHFLVNFLDNFFFENIFGIILIFAVISNRESYFSLLSIILHALIFPFSKLCYYCRFHTLPLTTNGAKEDATN